MNDLADRIQTKMSEHGISQADLMRTIGAARGTISGWVNGSNAPSAKHVDSLAAALRVSPTWLLTGRQPPTQFIQVEPWDDSTPLDDDEVEIPFFKDFSFACGSGPIHEAMINERRKLRMSKATLRHQSIQKSNAIAATASGNSMYPTVKDKDTIHIDLGRTTIKDGKIFAMTYGGLFMVKRLYNMPFGGVRIVSDNAIEFPEIVLTAQQIQEQEFKIIDWVWQIATMDTW